MNFKDFRLASSRSDKDGNDNIHYFSKFFADFFAYFFYKIRLSPNNVTFAFLILGCLSAFFLYSSFPIIAYLMWRLHIILDMSDGSLARATGVYSKNAIGFDRSNHIIINTSILLAPLHQDVNLIYVNCLLVTFYLYYFFSRNFVSDIYEVTHFSVSKNIFKDFLGLEGYIFSQSVVILLGLNGLNSIICYFYTFSFLILFLLKLAYRLRQ
jgi:hypothetical protein